MTLEDRPQRPAAPAPYPCRPRVRLSNTDGNVYALAVRCSKAALAAGWTPAQISRFRREVSSSGSYDQALQLMMRLFEVE